MYTLLSVHIQIVGTPKRLGMQINLFSQLQLTEWHAPAIYNHRQTVFGTIPKGRNGVLVVNSTTWCNFVGVTQ